MPPITEQDMNAMLYEESAVGPTLSTTISKCGKSLINSLHAEILCSLFRNYFWSYLGQLSLSSFQEVWE